MKQELSVAPTRAVSIVIPTYNRAEDLKDLLDSILGQTALPKKVIIADDSENLDTRDLVKQVRKNFLDGGILLKYLHKASGGDRSTTIAENVGLTYAKTPIVLFLDDDVVLDKKFIEKILEVYEKYPKAIGVQGYVTNICPWKNNMSFRLHNLFCRIFLLFFYEKDQCRVLPSGASTYPYQLCEVTECQRFSGSNQSYKREILQNHKFDENLKTYAVLDDLDISYRLFKKYPNSLYITPHAKCIHKASKTSRTPSKALTYMTTIYRTYFFYKNIEQTLLHKLCFVWNCTGQIVGSCILEIEYLLLRNKLKRKPSVRFLIQSYICALRHLKEIKMGNLKFLDKICF